MRPLSACIRIFLKTEFAPFCLLVHTYVNDVFGHPKPLQLFSFGLRSNNNKVLMSLRRRVKMAVSSKEGSPIDMNCNWDAF